MLPSSWPSYTATRQFRGARYKINVRREDGADTGYLLVDGQRVEGTLVPLAARGETVQVDVILPEQG